MEKMQEFSGWSVHNPWFLKETPAGLEDMLMEFRFKAHDRPDDFYDTREEAMGELRDYLTKLGEQAHKDIDFLSKPYTSPNGITYIDPPHLLKKWRAECQTKLEIAQRGLELVSEAEKKGG